MMLGSREIPAPKADFKKIGAGKPTYKLQVDSTYDDSRQERLGH